MKTKSDITTKVENQNRKELAKAGAKSLPPLPITTAKNHAQVSAGNIQPLDPHAHPLARDSQGLGSREEIRETVRMVSPPRQSLRPTERSGQKRSHK